jgi:DNA repair protein RadC
MAELVAQPMRAESEAPTEVAPSYTPSCQPVSQTGRKIFTNSAELWTDTREIARTETREHFFVYFLDVRHRLIGERWTVAIGSLTGVEVHPRELLREAIVRSAAAFICVHNHPSGDPEPSRADLELTRRIRDAGELVGITMLDHVVVATDGFVSLALRGSC